MINISIVNDPGSIKSKLEAPYCAISDALEADVARKLRDELLVTDLWEHNSEYSMSEKKEQRVANDFRYSREGISLTGHTGLPSLDQLFKYLNSADLLAWISEVSGRKCDIFEGTATIFRPGNHISRHNDCFSRTLANGNVQRRAVTFNYYLTTNWLAEWGGRLIWEKPRAEIVPSFNTLVLFLPTENSYHWVEAVNIAATEPRLAITGWFMTEWSHAENKLKIKI